jgi:hypothetical protein
MKKRKKIGSLVHREADLGVSLNDERRRAPLRVVNFLESLADRQRVRM